MIKEENISFASKPIRLLSDRFCRIFIPLLPLFLFYACGTSKNISKKDKIVLGKIAEIVKKQNAAETKGYSIDSYVLQNNDRIFFNGIKALSLEEYDTAYALFNYYNTLDSTNATVYYLLANIKIRANLPRQSLLDAKRAARLSPDNKWIQSLYANLLAFYDQYDKAADIYLKLAKQNPSDRSEYYTLAAQLFQKAEKYDLAIAALDTLQRYRPEDDEDVLMQKQRFYLGQKNYEKSIAITQQLIKAYPLEPKYVVMLSAIYELKNDTEKANEVMLDLEKKFPYNDDVSSYVFGYYLKKRDLSMVSKKLNDYVDAADHNREKELTILSRVGEYLSDNPGDTAVIRFVTNLTEKITTEKPQNFTAKRLLASLYLYSKREEQGMALTEKLIAEDKRNYQVWSTAMGYFLYSGRFDTATQYLNRMEDVFPDSIDIPYSRMLIAREKKDLNAALRHSLEGLDLSQKQKSDDREIMFYNSVAELYNDLKKYKESDSTYEALLKKDPENITALNNYAYYLSERGERLDYALNLSKKTLDQENREPNFLDTYGWILYKMQRYEEAKTYIQKAIAISGKNVSMVVMEHYADIEFRLGNVENAMKIWKAIDQTGQGSEFLKRKIKDKKIYE